MQFNKYVHVYLFEVWILFLNPSRSQTVTIHSFGCEMCYKSKLSLSFYLPNRDKDRVIFIFTRITFATIWYYLLPLYLSIMMTNKLCAGFCIRFHQFRESNTRHTPSSYCHSAIQHENLHKTSTIVRKFSYRILLPADIIRSISSMLTIMCLQWVQKAFNRWRNSFSSKLISGILFLNWHLPTVEQMFIFATVYTHPHTYYIFYMSASHDSMAVHSCNIHFICENFFKGYNLFNDIFKQNHNHQIDQQPTQLKWDLSCNSTRKS